MLGIFITFSPIYLLRAQMKERMIVPLLAKILHTDFQVHRDPLKIPCFQDFSRFQSMISLPGFEQIHIN